MPVAERVAPSPFAPSWNQPARRSASRSGKITGAAPGGPTTRSLVWGLGARTRRALHIHGYGLTKRLVDVAVAGIALALLLPLFVTIALLIVIDDRGPVLYRQTRVGAGGRRFQMWKLRSMSVGADRQHGTLTSDDGSSVRKKLRRDPRLTRLGPFLRRTSLDELPQLWNVLIGDMTLVGPRPPIPTEVSQYDSHSWQRLDLKPGLTCSWQVNGRADIPFDEQVGLDIDYALGRSLTKDFGLLLRTVPAVLSGRGAY